MKLTRESLLGIIRQYHPLFEETELQQPLKESRIDSINQLNIRIEIEKFTGYYFSHKEWFSFNTFEQITDFFESGK